MKIFNGKKGAAAGILAVLLIVIVAYLGYGYFSRECNSDKDCDGENYCGYDNKCHKPTIIEKTTINNQFDFKFAGTVLGISIIIAALILKYGKKEDKEQKLPANYRQYIPTSAPAAQQNNRPFYPPGNGNTTASARIKPNSQNNGYMNYNRTNNNNHYNNQGVANSRRVYDANRIAQSFGQTNTNQAYNQAYPWQSVNQAQRVGYSGRTGYNGYANKGCINTNIKNIQNKQQKKQTKKPNYSKDLKSVHKQIGNASRHTDIPSGNNPNSVVPKF